MATKKQLVDRWQTAPWSDVDRELVQFAARHAATQWTPPPPQEELFALLDGLPYRDEVPGGRDLRGSSFPGARNMDLRGTDFSFARDLGVLERCKLDEARIEENARPMHSLTGEARGASLRRAKLRKTWLHQSRFERCDFSGADLRSAMLIDSDLRGSIFRETNCEGADFQGCDLRGCDFGGANLTGTMFRNVRLDETTDLRGATLYDLVHDDLHDNSGRKVLGGTDWRLAQHDETTRVGTRPGAVEAQILGLIASAAKRTRAPWADTLAAEAKRLRPQVVADPTLRWYEALLDSVDPAYRADAELLMERASREL
jgi:uncharacterized protein YjbI with pentapeptide repeats